MKRGTARDIPPPLELECLKALWQMGEGGVKEVRGALLDRRPLAYTTVMTLLDRLVRKQCVARRKVGRSFVYVPLIDRDSLRKLAVSHLVECHFDGSAELLADYLSGTKLAALTPVNDPADKHYLAQSA